MGQHCRTWDTYIDVELLFTSLFFFSCICWCWRKCSAPLSHSFLLCDIRKDLVVYVNACELEQLDTLPTSLARWLLTLVIPFLWGPQFTWRSLKWTASFPSTCFHLCPYLNHPVNPQPVMSLPLYPISKLILESLEAPSVQVPSWVYYGCMECFKLQLKLHFHFGF